MLAVIVVENDPVVGLETDQILSNKPGYFPSDPSLKFKQIMIFIHAKKESFISNRAFHQEKEEFREDGSSFVGRQVFVIFFSSYQRFGMYDVSSQTKDLEFAIEIRYLSAYRVQLIMEHHGNNVKR